MKNAVQRFGKFLSSMVMPNIGAFIAWGFITALFIEKGWLPNAQLATLNGPMLNYLLPVLIAFQGGKLIGGDRGGVMGAIATIGVIVGAPDYPMLMGAMVMGPLAGFVIKKFDQAMDGRMPAGFEMLINNFSIGIFGMLLAIVGYYAIGPFMSAVLVGQSFSAALQHGGYLGGGQLRQQRGLFRRGHRHPYYQHAYRLFPGIVQRRRRGHQPVLRRRPRG